MNHGLRQMSVGEASTPRLSVSPSIILRKCCIAYCMTNMVTDKEYTCLEYVQSFLWKVNTYNSNCIIIHNWLVILQE